MKITDQAKVQSLCFPSKETTKRNTFVTGALTYELSDISPDGTFKNPFTILLWFATASRDPKTARFQKSGFSLFLLHLLLKRCAIQAHKVDGIMTLPPLSIFLQVQPTGETEVAVQYYESLGFDRVNNLDVSNGMSHIPLSLSQNLSNKEFINEKECKIFLLHYVVAGKDNGMTNNLVSKIVSSVASSLLRVIPLV